MPPLPPSSPKPLSRRGLIFVLIVCGCMLLAFGYLSVRQWMEPKKDAKVPVARPIDVREQILQSIARHFTVPNETPAFERVTDPAFLQSANPVFYKDVRVGDWVLRYASVVILYRADEDRIIAMLPSS